MSQPPTLTVLDYLRAPGEPSQERRVELHEIQMAVWDAIARLPEREQLAVARRYGILDRGEGDTLLAVGGILGTSIERVRQLEVRALRRMQPYLMHLAPASWQASATGAGTTR